MLVCGMICIVRAIYFDSIMKWQTVKRTLTLIQQLQQKPATRTQIIDFWYTSGIEEDDKSRQTDKTLARRFDRAIENARMILETSISVDSTYHYHLDHVGPFFGLDPDDDVLQSLALLMMTFEADELLSQQIEPLVSFVQAALTSNAQRRLYQLQPKLKLDLRRLDDGVIDARVWEQISFASKNKRIVSFYYKSSAHADRQARWHRVEPQKIELRGGHWMLQAYGLYWKNPAGEESQADTWLPFRFDLIQAEGLEVHRGTFNRKENRPKYRIHYRLDPKLARGNPSRYFEEMEFKLAEDGWLDCFGRTNSLFEAERTLLRYGQRCVVISPPELREKMRETIMEMLVHYQIAG